MEQQSEETQGRRPKWGRASLAGLRAAFQADTGLLVDHLTISQITEPRTIAPLARVPGGDYIVSRTLEPVGARISLQAFLRGKHKRSRRRRRRRRR
eukprot:4068553-Pyramimonas_sp.AAC.1